MNIGAFACLMGMRRGGRSVEQITDLSGLGKTHPAMAAALTVMMFSMAGIPPLAGFFGKLYIFLAAIESGLYTLSVIGVLASVVSAYYYLRIIKVMYFDEPGIEALDSPLPRSVSSVLTVCTVIILLFVFFPTPVLDAAKVAASSLF
jgi:NADH-quinone oxidoreductase subunit N